MTPARSRGRAELPRPYFADWISTVPRPRSRPTTQVPVQTTLGTGLAADAERVIERAMRAPAARRRDAGRTGRDAARRRVVAMGGGRLRPQPLHRAPGKTAQRVGVKSCLPRRAALGRRVGRLDRRLSLMSRLNPPTTAIVRTPFDPEAFAHSSNVARVLLSPGGRQTPCCVGNASGHPQSTGSDGSLALAATRPLLELPHLPPPCRGYRPGAFGLADTAEDEAGGQDPARAR